MRRLIILLVTLFIFILPSIVKASPAPTIKISAPQNIICNQPFIVNYNLENLPVTLEYKIKSWTESDLGSNINTQNWNPKTKVWHNAYKTSRYYINKDSLSGSIIINILDCSNPVVKIKTNINYCIVDSCKTYSSNVEQSFIINLENPQIFNLNLPNETQSNSYYLDINNNYLNQPLCLESELCVTDSIQLPGTLNLESINIYDSYNKLEYKSIITGTGVSFQKYEFDCSMQNQSFSGYEYTEKNIDFPACDEETKQLIIDESGNSFGNLLVFPKNINSLNIYLKRYFPNNFITLQLITINTLDSQNQYLSEVSVVGDEWIEIFNPYNEDLNFCNWSVDDGVGGSTPVIFEKDCSIPSNNYKQIFLGKHIFNDSGDNFYIFDANNNLITQFKYDSIKDSQSLIFYESRWQITEKPTPSQANIYFLNPKVELAKIQDNLILDETIYPININEVPNYNGKIVKITGKIIEPKGSSWYLEDSTGKVKIYLQAKYKIKHPRFSTGMTLSVTGLVNYYKNYWRILPNKAEDIEIINLPQKTKKVKIEPKKESPKLSISLANKAIAQETYIYSPINSPPELIPPNSSQSNQLQHIIYLVIINCLIFIILWYDKITRNIYFKRKSD